MIKMLSPQFAVLALFVSLATALTPDPQFHQDLQGKINPAGVSYATTPIDLTIVGSRGVYPVPQSVPDDFAVYTLGSNSNATCDSEWPLDPTSADTPERYSGDCVTTEPTDFLIECHVPKNANGDDNFVYVSFGENTAQFKAYGDAKAGFAPAPIPPIPTILQGGPAIQASIPPAIPLPVTAPPPAGTTPPPVTVQPVPAPLPNPIPLPNPPPVPNPAPLPSPQPSPGPQPLPNPQPVPGPLPNPPPANPTPPPTGQTPPPPGSQAPPPTVPFPSPAPIPGVTTPPPIVVTPPPTTTPIPIPNPAIPVPAVAPVELSDEATSSNPVQYVQISCPTYTSPNATAPNPPTKRSIRFNRDFRF